MSHHECQSDSCCGEDQCHNDERCSDQACRCNCHKKHKYCHQLLELADDAWMEVLKEEIKKEIVKNSGAHLKKMAELVTKTNHKRWTEKIEEKHNIEVFEEELRNLMFHKKK